MISPEPIGNEAAKALRWEGERVFLWQSDRGNDTKGYCTLITTKNPEQLAIGLWSALI